MAIQSIVIDTFHGIVHASFMMELFMTYQSTEIGLIERGRRLWLMMRIFFLLAPFARGSTSASQNGHQQRMANTPKEATEITTLISQNKPIS